MPARPPRTEPFCSLLWRISRTDQIGRHVVIKPSGCEPFRIKIQQPAQGEDNEDGD
jgi:hypothetical protein